MKVPIMSVNEAVDDIYSDSEDEAGPTEIECGLNGGDIRVPEPDENQNCEQIQWSDYPNGNWDDIQLTNFAASQNGGNKRKKCFSTGCSKRINSSCSKCHKNVCKEHSEVKLACFSCSENN